MAMLLALAAPPARASFQVTGDVACDNSHALYTGTATSATTLIGGGNYDPVGTGAVTTYSFSTSDPYLYIAAWEDRSLQPPNQLQGLLHDLNVSGVDVWSNSPSWQVYWTDLCPCAPYPGGAPSLAQMNAAIAAGNLAGWLTPVIGGANNGLFPPSGPFTWPVLPQIDPSARWTWWCANCAGSAPDAPFYPAYNYGEYEIYRLNMGDLPVPVEGSSWGKVKMLYK
jgi:hypothetical protein